MKVKVAIAGIGNCTSVLLQAIQYYSKDISDGLWHPVVGGMRVKDIEIVAAFDIDARKVGLDLADAIFAKPNAAHRFVKVPQTGIDVKAGLTMGDVPPHLSNERIASISSEEVIKVLKKSNADVLLNLISSGTERSSFEYAKAALQANCSFINCTPALVANNSKLASLFKRKKVAIVGDDLMSQFGGTIFHKGILSLMVKRGIRVTKSYQLDVGGGSETFNTIDEQIKMAKRKIKTEAVSMEVPYQFETVAGTTDFVDYMGNERTSYFWIEGKGLLGSQVTIDVYLRSSDGANAGNILLDTIRAVAASIKSKQYGCIEEICAYGFKSSPRQIHFEQAYELFEQKFIKA